MSDRMHDAEIDALAAALQRHDPEPYMPGTFEDERYYREYAAAIIASGLRVMPPAKTSIDATEETPK